MERFEAWFHQAVIDHAPVRFYKHNAQFEAGDPLDRSRWNSLEARWFDTQYQIESFEASMAGKCFPAETFPVFFPNLGPSLYSLMRPIIMSMQWPGAARTRGTRIPLTRRGSSGWASG